MLDIVLPEERNFTKIDVMAVVLLEKDEMERKGKSSIINRFKAI